MSLKLYVLGIYSRRKKEGRRKISSLEMVSAIHPATMYHLHSMLWGDIPGDRQKFAIPKKSDSDEFNWLWDNNYTFLYRSLLFL
ncbi:MAG: hypothetical protein LH628_06600 [Microcoleus sp. CAN_BIN18]|nr:hypothetical protein [Microcoleus sp. CAN_BIN18]